jgi:hypothetical protein
MPAPETREVLGAAGMKSFSFPTEMTLWITSPLSSLLVVDPGPIRGMFGCVDGI